VQENQSKLEEKNNSKKVVSVHYANKKQQPPEVLNI
jgi:hypothetical protein